MNFVTLIGVAYLTFIVRAPSKNPNEQQAFYQACTSSDVVLKQSYHNKHFAQTLDVLQKHVSYLVTELEETSEFKWKKDIDRHPRLPLLLRHNEFVRSTFEVVQETIDPMSV